MFFQNANGTVVQRYKLAAMGWHCITIWECELKPSKREETLRSLVYTLNKIWLDDHSIVGKPYPKLEDEDGMLRAAEEQI